MADTTTLQPTLPEKKRNTVSQMIGGTFEDLAGDILESITGIQNVPESFEARESVITSVPEYVKKTFGSGSIENFNEARPKTDAELLAEQRAAVAEAEMALRRSRAGFILQEELRHEVAGMSEVERNERLHLNTSLRKKLTEDAYHTTELYRQKKEELVVKAEQIKNATEIPSPAKQPSVLDAAFEGRSGTTQGGGTANLSAQAVG